jgi:Amt family ammonium transporter
MDTGDTTFILLCAALVMFMTPGLALFYGGMVRSKNILGTLMQSFFALGFVSILWVLIGYTLAFGPDKAGLIGGLDFLAFKGVGAEPGPFADTIPHTAFATFQMMFAVITPALITGAFAERTKFSGYVLFTGLWLILVYSPVAHWVWGGGWIGELGVLDFAGGTVVHINAGIAALALVLVIGPRKGFGKNAFIPHNLPMTVLGAGILWVGWFGFNAGSALAADGLASSALLATHLGAAGGAVGWALFESRKDRKATSLGIASGAIAGLVAITPAAGFVGTLPAIAIGLAGGVICAYAVGLKFRFGYDDSLDVVGVHLVGGIVGALLTGIFADTLINGAGADGLLTGGGLTLLGKQVIGIAATLLFSFVVSYGLAKLVQATVGLRVSEEEEFAGIDLAQHSEAGYSFGESGGGSLTGSTSGGHAVHAPAGALQTQGGGA